MYQKSKNQDLEYFNSIIGNNVNDISVIGSLYGRPYDAGIELKQYKEDLFKAICEFRNQSPQLKKISVKDYITEAVSAYNYTKCNMEKNIRLGLVTASCQRGKLLYTTNCLFFKLFFDMMYLKDKTKKCYAIYCLMLEHTATFDDNLKKISLYLSKAIMPNGERMHLGNTTETIQTNHSFYLIKRNYLYNLALCIKSKNDCGGIAIGTDECELGIGMTCKRDAENNIYEPQTFVKVLSILSNCENNELFSNKFFSNIKNMNFSLFMASATPHAYFGLIGTKPDVEACKNLMSELSIMSLGSHPQMQTFKKLKIAGWITTYNCTSWRDKNGNIHTELLDIIKERLIYKSNGALLIRLSTDKEKISAKEKTRIIRKLLEDYIKSLYPNAKFEDFDGKHNKDKVLEDLINADGLTVIFLNQKISRSYTIQLEKRKDIIAWIEDPSTSHDITGIQRSARGTGIFPDSDRFHIVMSASLLEKAIQNDDFLEKISLDKNNGKTIIEFSTEIYDIFLKEYAKISSQYFTVNKRGNIVENNKKSCLGLTGEFANN